MNVRPIFRPSTFVGRKSHSFRCLTSSALNQRTRPARRPFPDLEARIGGLRCAFLRSHPFRLPLGFRLWFIRDSFFWLFLSGFLRVPCQRRIGRNGLARKEIRFGANPESLKNFLRADRESSGVPASARATPAPPWQRGKFT